MEALNEFFRSLWVVWLSLLFLGIVVWALWPSNRRKMEEYGRIPFEEDRPNTGGKE
jgi:cytochrome c oxidase cbb3-type subunit 4